MVKWKEKYFNIANRGKIKAKKVSEEGNGRLRIRGKMQLRGPGGVGSRSKIYKPLIVGDLVENKLGVEVGAVGAVHDESDQPGDSGVSGGAAAWTGRRLNVGQDRGTAKNSVLDVALQFGGGLHVPAGVHAEDGQVKEAEAVLM